MRERKHDVQQQVKLVKVLDTEKGYEVPEGWELHSVVPIIGYGQMTVGYTLVLTRPWHDGRVR